jgi:hypothetical protein
VRTAELQHPAAGSRDVWGRRRVQQGLALLLQGALLLEECAAAAWAAHEPDMAALLLEEGADAAQLEANGTVGEVEAALNAAATAGRLALEAREADWVALGTANEIAAEIAAFAQAAGGDR